MYIVIFEDGDIRRATTLLQADFDSADEGLIDILDVSGEIPFHYVNGKWLKLKEIN